jgi:hypothetical protein
MPAGNRKFDIAGAIGIAARAPYGYARSPASFDEVSGSGSGTRRNRAGTVLTRVGGPTAPCISSDKKRSGRDANETRSDVSG